jgi:hypothetical protein
MDDSTLKLPSKLVVLHHREVIYYCWTAIIKPQLDKKSDQADTSLSKDFATVRTRIVKAVGPLLEAYVLSSREVTDTNLQ